MPNANLRKRIEVAPGGVALPHGLLSLPTVIGMEDVHEQMGVDWQPMSCGVAATTGWCPPDVEDEEERRKTFVGIGSSTVEPVTAYAGVDCSTVGWTFDEGRDRAEAILTTGEQKALEAWAWDNIIVAAGVDDVSAVAGDASIVGRLSALENALAQVYGGTGVVHVPVALASFLQTHGLAIQQGRRLRTLAGHDIVIGAGYPGAEDGAAQMAITGPVHVRQGQVDPAPRTDQEAVNTSTNDRLVLVERTSVVLIECDRFVTSVELTCCGVVTS